MRDLRGETIYIYDACNTFSQYSLMRLTSYERLIYRDCKTGVNTGIVRSKLDKTRKEGKAMPLYVEMQIKIRTYFKFYSLHREMTNRLLNFFIRIR